MPAASTGSLLTAAAGDTVAFLGQLAAGHEAEQASLVDSGTIAQIAELNAQLIEQGGDLNAGVHDFNAAMLEFQAKDAITRGAEAEDLFRKQLKGVIGSQRASFAAQGIDVDSGSALDVQKDTAYQGELDALTIRANSAREAWGYSMNAKNETLQAISTRKLSTLQAANTRQVGQANSLNARVGGSIKQSAANWGAASTLLTGAADIYSKSKYGS